jgi:hypothetical protein
MREAGDVCYADVLRDGTGVVEFVRKEDMSYAVRKLDNTKFRSHEVGWGCGLTLSQQAIDLELGSVLEMKRKVLKRLEGGPFEEGRC